MLCKALFRSQQDQILFAAAVTQVLPHPTAQRVDLWCGDRDVVSICDLDVATAESIVRRCFENNFVDLSSYPALYNELSQEVT